MDNIQFWIYVIFAVIYFLSRSLRKKTQEKNPNKPQSPLETETNSPQAPVSFEDLLEEITGRRSLKEEARKEEEPEDESDLSGRERKWDPQELPPSFEEGRSRSFSDEESRRIYEESIKNAEGFDIEYGVDEKFASRKVLRSTAEEEEENEFAKEIRESLSNPDSAKTAIILSEILNRKY